MTVQLDKKMECVKCGFTPNYNKDWALSFKGECTTYGYNKCDWDDSETKEHLHQECPDCGYSITVPCVDSEVTKAGTWSTTKPVVVQPVANGGMGMMKPAVAAVVNNLPRKVTPATTVRPATMTFTPAKPAKCGSCPVDAK